MRLVSVVTSTRSPRPRSLADFMQQVVNLSLDRANFDGRIDQAGRPDDLLDDHSRRFRQLIRPRRRRDIDRLVHAMLEFFERKRTIVERRRQTEAVLDQRLLARAVAVIHAMQLRHGLMRLVDEHQIVARKVIQQSRRRLARKPSGKMPRVVFNAMAVAHGFDHFKSYITR